MSAGPPEPTDADYREAAALRAALRRFMRTSEEVARRHGLTPQRYLLLVMIRAPLGEVATVGELAGRMRLAQGAVSDLVARAERAGLLGRRPLADGRSLGLELTPEGARRLAGAVAELGPERAALRAALSPRA
ncbi:MAG: MarR family transcriptional regulator [Thermoleophilia bacterium]|nr:MarR family transcriptional regulator [Thermoleophilia bacterium]